MPVPERRTRADLIVAAVLVVAVLVAACVVWLRSDARGTTSITWDGSATAPPVAESVPDTLEESWRAPSSATAHAVVIADTVATADGDTVVGRDLRTGAERWSYRRDRPLCAAIGAWGSVVSVFNDPRGCGQVTALDAATGARGAQRSSDTDSEVRLVDTGTHLIALGDTRLEVWRSDLVRTVEYGRVDAPVNPNAQPRSGCVLRSADADDSHLAVLEQCAREPGGRLTLLDTTPEDSQKPEEFASSILPAAVPDGDAQIVAVVDDHTAVYLPPGPDGGARLEVFDASGSAVDRHELPQVAGPDAATGPADGFDDLLLWWTGTDTVALDTEDFRPLWTVESTLGRGSRMAGSVLLPIDDAIAVVDPATGEISRTIDVDRDTDTTVSLSVAGDTVLEQRGDDVVALTEVGTQ
ncbi:putative pyrroloquinoline-quinone binding quinoprotein [Rhodococcus sp. SMB37]|uniref:Rv3212 family protein n=1 Tax=Rhodococcus sp. SMB37 TaxID=2512213 RepID=UPI00104427F4|nr:PQQ-binding-like beta-propeller repeat protein [Rhodococcus sp. SMB37]TCN57092.1 putative pyrroloquinoline-quinone binding quinoprotein [Rhodococcus sp. SMB37]